MPLAVLTLVDGITLALLGLFCVWGAIRGPLRQIGSLLLLAGAFPLATRYGPRLEEPVVRAVSSNGADAPVVAWTVVFVSVLLVGSLLLALIQPLLRRRSARPGWGGALLGLLLGVALLTVLGHGFLAAFRDANRPAWVIRIETSRSAQAVREMGRAVRGVLALPEAVEARIDVVDGRIGP